MVQIWYNTITNKRKYEQVTTSNNKLKQVKFLIQISEIKEILHK